MNSNANNQRIENFLNDRDSNDILNVGETVHAVSFWYFKNLHISFHWLFIMTFYEAPILDFFIVNEG